MPKEANSTIATTMNSVTDYIRIIKDGMSQRMSPTNFATVISSALSSIVGTEKVREVSSGQSFLSTDNTLLVDSSGGNVQINLPNPSSVWNATDSKSNSIRIVQKVSGGNTVTIAQYDSEDIYVNGAAATSVALTGGSAATLVTDGTDFIVVGS